jgi:hypothetical protein
MDPRICVSLPVHERPEVVFDQVENLRAFLPASTQVVLHVSQSLGVDPADVSPLMPPGVHVNPRSHNTSWGDILGVHNDNLRFALAELEPFDYVLLHASNDLYFRTGAGHYVAGAQAGFTGAPVTPDMQWPWAAPAHRDPMLGAILRDVGQTEIFVSQIEGSFYATDLFREMLERIERHFRPGEGERYVREEIYYPTLARHLASGPFAKTFVYWDADLRRSVAPATVWGLLDGSFAGSQPHYDFDNLFAVKRVDRVLDDPVRTLLRALARARATRMRIRPPFEARRFVALCFGADVVADPTLIPAWVAAFDARDQVTLAILLDAGDDLPAIVDAARRGGAEDPDGPELIVLAADRNAFEDAALRWAVQAVYRPDDAPSVPRFDDAPQFSPESIGMIRSLVARWLALEAPDDGE